jgi:hypothetical protein
MTVRKTLADIGWNDDIANPYDHLIETEDMPTLGKTAFRCKEHPKIWDTDLDDLMVSHFIPKHGTPHA